MTRGNGGTRGNDGARVKIKGGDCTVVLFVHSLSVAAILSEVANSRTLCALINC